MNSNIHLLLDRYLEALAKRGYEIESESGDSKSAREVRGRLENAGLHPRPEVMDFFTWRCFPNLGKRVGVRTQHFFHRISFPLNVTEAIQLQRSYAGYFRSLLADEGRPGDEPHEVFPGPDFMLPIASAVVDSAELLSVDCRADPDGGGVYEWSLAGGTKRFASLADAIGIATYCVESDLWLIHDSEIRVAHSPTTQVDSGAAVRESIQRRIRRRDEQS